VRTVLLNDAIERGDYKNEEVGKVIYPQPAPLIGEATAVATAKNQKSCIEETTFFLSFGVFRWSRSLYYPNSPCSFSASLSSRRDA
jgi:hypothetical protein